jgi:hypothetical protein
MTSGTPAGQAFSQGFGVYQQLMAQEKGSQQQEFMNKLREREVSAKEAQVDIAETQAETAATRAKAALKAAEVKQPKGVDKDIWKQALDTEKAGAGLDEYGNPMPVDASAVYRRYNSMVTDDKSKAYMPFGMSETTALINAATKNPAYADLLFSEAGTLYGADKVGRLQARWQKLQEKKAAEDAAKAAEDAAATPPATPPAAAPTPTPLATYPTMPVAQPAAPASYGALRQMMGY